MENSLDAIAKAEDDALDANKSPSFKSVSTTSDADAQERDAAAAKREASIVAQIEFLENLPEESVISYLEAQIAPFQFPKQCTVLARKLSKENLKLFYRFLKVDKVTVFPNRVSEITYTFKDSRIGTELFEEKLETLRQELDRVRTALDSRKLWLAMFPGAMELLDVRTQVHNEIDQLSNYINANTPDRDGPKQTKMSSAMKKLENLIMRKEELFLIASDLREKEMEVQDAMKSIDNEIQFSQEIGAVFDLDESWTNDAGRESLESLLAKIVPDKQRELEDYDMDDADNAVFDEVMNGLREEGSHTIYENQDQSEEPAVVGSKTENKGSKEEIQENKEDEDGNGAVEDET